MFISETTKYINQNLIDGGYMIKSPYAVRLDRYFTDEEKSENRQYYESHTEAEWAQRCDNFTKRLSAENHQIMEVLKQHFKIGQYDNYSLSDCDLWFWCNHFADGSGRDYSYITLTVSDKADISKNMKIWAELKRILADYPASNTQAIFQWGQVENNEKAEQDAKAFYNAHEGGFVKFCGSVGRLLEYSENRYFFKKKGKKKYGYILSPMDVVGKCSAITVVI